MLFSDNGYQDRRTVLITNDKSLKDLLSCSIAVNDLSPLVEAPTPKSRSLCAASLLNTQIYGTVLWSDWSSAAQALSIFAGLPGTQGKVKANQLKVGSTAHKLQHANPFHRCSHLGVKWFKVIEVPYHWDLFTFPVGGCGLMLQNGQQWYQIKRNFPSYKRNNKNPQKTQSKIWPKVF